MQKIKHGHFFGKQYHPGWPFHYLKALRLEAAIFMQSRNDLYRILKLQIMKGPVGIVQGRCLRHGNITSGQTLVIIYSRPPQVHIKIVAVTAQNEQGQEES